MKNVSTQNWLKKNWMILAVILIAFFLRLYRIDELMRFLWDEARDMIAIRDIIVNRDITLFGPYNEIDGHKDFFGVFHYYLMLPALWLAHFDPVGPAVFTALLGSLSIYFYYIWVKNFTNEKTALATAALLAVSPLVVRFQQFPWNPNTIAFFGSLYLLVLQKWQKQPRLAFAFAAGFLLGLLFQLHYFTIALAAAALVAWCYTTPKKWLHAFTLVAAFILPNLTFVVFDLTHQGFYSSILLESFSGDSQQKFFVFSLTRFITAPVLYLFDVSSKFLASKTLGVALTISMIAFLVLQIKKIFTTQKNSSKKLTLEYLQLAASWMAFLGIIIFFPSLHDDYQSGMLWITLALITVRVLQKITKKLWHVLLVVILIWLCFANQLWRQPAWEENMPRIRTAALAIAEDAKNKTNVNVASFVDPQTRAIRFRYFISNEKIQLLGVDDYTQTETLYAVTEKTWEETIQNPAWELNGFRDASASAIWSDNSWTVWRAEK